MYTTEPSGWWTVDITILLFLSAWTVTIFFSFVMKMEWLFYLYGNRAARVGVWEVEGRD